MLVLVGWCWAAGATGRYCCYASARRAPGTRIFCGGGSIGKIAPTRFSFLGVTVSSFFGRARCRGGASSRCQLAVLGRAARGSWRGQTPGPPAAHTAPTHSDGGESGTRGGRPHRAERCMRVSCSHHCLPTTHQKDGENGISYCFSDFSIDHLLVTYAQGKWKTSTQKRFNSGFAPRSAPTRLLCYCQ